MILDGIGVRVHDERNQRRVGEENKDERLRVLAQSIVRRAPTSR
jgi:hypothetical protein